MTRPLKIIVAVGRGGEINYRNSLPWERIPRDMDHFRSLTKDSTVIMGRGTFESIGCRPLPCRENFVLSRTLCGIEGIRIISSLQEALHIATFEETFLIGGQELFRQALVSDWVSEVYLTRVHAEFPRATVFFQEKLMYGRFTDDTSFLVDDGDDGGYDVTYHRYVRIA